MNLKFILKRICCLFPVEENKVVQTQDEPQAVGLSKITSLRKKRSEQCEHITIEQCTNINYNMTIMPNSLGGCNSQKYNYTIRALTHKINQQQPEMETQIIN